MKKMSKGITRIMVSFGGTPQDTAEMTPSQVKSKKVINNFRKKVKTSVFGKKQVKKY